MGSVLPSLAKVPWPSFFWMFCFGIFLQISTAKFIPTYTPNLPIYPWENVKAGGAIPWFYWVLIRFYALVQGPYRAYSFGWAYGRCLESIFRGSKSVYLHKTRSICYNFSLATPLVWRGQRHFRAPTSLSLSSWLTMSSHKATCSQTSRPSLWHWGRRGETCHPNRHRSCPAVSRPGHPTLRPNIPATETARPGPEIGGLCFHSSFRGHTLAFLLPVDSLFCIPVSWADLYMRRIQNLIF